MGIARELNMEAKHLRSQVLEHDMTSTHRTEASTDPGARQHEFRKESYETAAEVGERATQRRD